MKPEVTKRGKTGRYSWKVQFEGSSYNQGAVMIIAKQRYHLDTYEAQDKAACEAIAKRIVEKMSLQ